jgi:hypothetical protein
MCLFVIFAALSMHYMQLAEKTQDANARSDPLVAFDRAYSVVADDEPTTQPALSSTSSADLDE